MESVSLAEARVALYRPIEGFECAAKSEACALRIIKHSFIEFSSRSNARLHNATHTDTAQAPTQAHFTVYASKMGR